MKKLLLFLALVALPAWGQTTAITGKVQDLGAAAASNSYVEFQLKNFGSNIPRVSGTSILGQVKKRFNPDSNGDVSGSLYSNSAITPAGTYYRMCSFDRGRRIRCNDYTVSGATFNISSATPITSTPVTAVTPTQIHRSHVHTQGSAATTWTITHNFSSIDTPCDFFNSSDQQIFPDLVTQTDANTVTAQWVVAQAGKAICWNTSNFSLLSGIQSVLITNPTASQAITGGFDVALTGNFIPSSVADIRYLGGEFGTIQSSLSAGTGTTVLPPTFTGGLAAKLSVASNRTVFAPALGTNSVQLANSVDDHALENSDTAGGNSNIALLGLTLDFNGANQTSDTHGIRFQRVNDFWLVNSVIKDAHHHNVFPGTASGSCLSNRWFFSNTQSSGAGQGPAIDGDGFRGRDSLCKFFGVNLLALDNSHHGLHVSGQQWLTSNLIAGGNDTADIVMSTETATFSGKVGLANFITLGDATAAQMGLLMEGVDDVTLVNGILSGADNDNWRTNTEGVSGNGPSRILSCNILSLNAGRYGFRNFDATDVSFCNIQSHLSGEHGVLIEQPTLLIGGIVKNSSQDTVDTFDGVSISAGTTDWTLLGFRIYDDQGTPTQRRGISVTTGTSDRYIIAFNQMSGNASSPFSDGGTGDEKVIFGNLPRTIKNYIPQETVFSVVNSTDFPIQLQVDDDTNVRFRIRADGLMQWGSGSVSPDTGLDRAGANALRIVAGDSLQWGTGAPVTKHLSGTASLNYDLSGAGITCQDLDITGFSGLVDGDTVVVGIPVALASTAGVEFSWWVKNSTTVTVRACDVTSGNPDPSAATVRADVWQH
jgi:hypothetical protein